MNISKFTITELGKGQKTSFKKKILLSAVDDFSSLSGDVSPLHMDKNFSQERGFQGRVVHGALLISYLSRILICTL